MPSFNFIENAEEIFNESVAATPFPFRKKVESGLIELLMEHYGEEEEISEAQLVEVIKKNTPEPFIAMGISAIKPFITDPDLADI